MGFNKGADAIGEQEEAAKAARKAAFSAGRLDYFTLKSGDSTFIRFLTPAEDWIKVAQHSGVQTKPSSGAENWPKSMGAVCRYDMQIKEILGTEDCYVCDHKLLGFGGKFAKPSGKTWALAVMRKRVAGPQGKAGGLEDVLEQYEILDANGNTTGRQGERPKIVILNQSWGNFFAAIKHAWDNYGTVNDRDFVIRRVGDGTDTDYHSLPLDPVPGVAPGTEAWQRYEQSLAERKISLEDIVLKQAGDEHYARWFDTSKEVSEEGKVVAAARGGGSGNSSASTPQGEEQDEASRAKLASLRDRLSGGSAQS